MTPDELLALIDQAAAGGWTELDLSGQGLTELPPEIGKLTQLETLVLGKFDREQGNWVGNQLTNLPDEIVQLNNLITLSLGGNQISQIPEVIKQLSSLRELYFANNQISKIPNSITQLTNLSVLSLYSNQISQIPEAISQLRNLAKLYLGNNQIDQIPEIVRLLGSLSVLSIYSNQISCVPETIGQLSNLTKLYLANNQISQIPEPIGQLFSLNVLSFANNRIIRIPETIGQLSNLNELYLNNNQISCVPETIGQLSNLTKLYLANNQISQIPETIGQLSSLSVLYLEHNQISYVPECLENLPNLKKLDLRQNPLPISPELLGTSNLRQDPGLVEGIFDYCRQLRSGLVRPLNEIKLLLVGQGSVGKTSLIKRLIENRYNPNEAQTDGLSVTPWPIEVNSKQVRVNVWDFGGQEIYHATHQFFLTKRSLYILVVNCRTGDENQIDYWLKLIESFGDQSPVIIVGNKCDEQPLDLNRRALREKYPNIRAILETSCQTNYGIEDLRAAIYKEISDLKEVYDLLPLSWFEVKQQLEQLDEDCISYARYVGICAKQEISEEIQQERLIELLHDLGLVLNFRKHPILQNTSVLKPNWVTEGIYSLLSDDDLKTINKGILTTDDLSRILDADRYPANRHHFLIELIKQFQLGFPLDETRLLIPGLLPKEEPEDTQLEGETLDFQYHYSVLPDSIISRFIVLIHSKIHNHTYWRTGVMLAYCESNGTILNLARVRSDPADCKISITINGRETTRRSFLALIRDVFHQIHHSFANLDVTEWVPVPGYPNHSPLDYQELLGLEAMGIQDYPIGKLGVKVNVRQLLDGYEPIESRQFRRMRDQGIDMDSREAMPGIYLNINQNNQDHRKTTHQHGQGDNVAGDLVKGDKTGGDKVGGDKIEQDKIQNE